MHIGYWWENQKEINNWEDQDVFNSEWEQARGPNPSKEEEDDDDEEEEEKAITHPP
jgi:hypothetical protein